MIAIATLIESENEFDDLFTLFSRFDRFCIKIDNQLIDFVIL